MNQKSNLSKSYLVFYNFTSAVGWLVILIQTLKTTLTWHSSSDFIEGKNIYENIRAPLKFFLAVAFVEIVHASLGLVKSSPVITFNQVFIRFLVIWGIADNFYTAQRDYGIVILGVVWPLSEVVRYFYYAFNLLGIDLGVLKWSRYSFFIVLYPLGVWGEIKCILAAAKYVEPMSVRAEYSFYLPNKFNFSYDFYWILLIWILLYLPGFPVMYKHMLVQRKKYLSPKTSHSKSD